MATTSKSKTTRTTKTSKAKKPVATKTTPKAVKAKSVAKTKAVVTKKTTEKASVTASSKVLTPFERVRSVQIAFGLANIVFAAVVATLTAAAVAVKLGFQAKDEFASKTDKVLGDSHEVIFNLNPHIVLIAALAFSGLASVLVATRFKQRYEKAINYGASGLRWLIMGISSALLIAFVGLLVGIDDLAVLKMMEGLIILTTMLSFMAERENIAAVRPKWFAFTLSLFAGFLAWLPIIASLIGTTIFGSETFEPYVYGIAGVTLLGFTGFALNQYRHLKNRATAVYADVEARYLRIDLVTKFIVVLILVLHSVTK